MFERYTEKARRVIFFARHEASDLGCKRIEPEHLLLGIFREDMDLAKRFLPPHAVLESIRKQIEEHTPVREKLSTSVDIPLSAESKCVLEFAAAEAADQREIHMAHLWLGLLRAENCYAAEILHRYGLSLAAVRQDLEGDVPSGTVKRTQSKPTACRDCKHLIIDGPFEGLNLYCGASPRQPGFDCYTGEFKINPSARPSQRFQSCDMINFGECQLFEPKEQ
jgi:ATP-dependent Clp protease ATP-binding subunit ClpC